MASRDTDPTPHERAADLAFCNGVDGTTGRYALEPLNLMDIVHAARAQTAPCGPRPRTRRGYSALGADRLNDLAKVGWGVIFPKGTSAEIRGALEPLLALRRGDARGLFKVFDFDPPSDSLHVWLARQGVAPGFNDQKSVPFYLLIVGPPTEIPFEIQYLLDIEYAVGRIAFDTPEEYASYARSVVDYERGGAALAAKEVVYWAPEHEGDQATSLSSRFLVSPLADGSPDEAPIAQALGFRSTAYRRSAATKGHLLGALHRSADRSPPAVLFTASHGLSWPRNHRQQAACQGALLTQEWSLFDEVGPDHRVAASDIRDDARVHGMMAFTFACFSAGTPAFDSFRTRREKAPARLAEGPFLSALPQRLLAHPNGGALATIGHVDRAWGFSIRPSATRATARVGPFQFCVESILGGHRVGIATTDLSQRYAVLGTELSSILDGGRGAATDREIAWSFIERNDAQSYVVLGDPAARLRLDRLSPS